MIGSLPWRALMRRNVIYRRRNPVGTLFEFFLPIAFVGIMVAIKSAVQRSGSLAGDVIDEVIPDVSLTFAPVTFDDYVVAMQTNRTCARPPFARPGSNDFWISGIPYQGYNWPVPFVKCDSEMCKTEGEDAQKYCSYGILAVSGSDDTDTGGNVRAQQFKSWVYDTYPALDPENGKMPFDYEAVQVMASSKAMDEYVKNGDYSSLTNPNIVMGVVFQGNDANTFRYTLRQNSTNYNAPENADRPAVRTTPPTDTLFDSYAKDDFSACDPEGGTAYQGFLGNSCTGQYLYNGIIPIQRLVHDFIYNVTQAADAGYYVSEGGVRFVPFPSPAYEEDGFYSNVGTFLPLLLVLGLLYPVSCMISPIVREKQLRQKELMKMMSVSETDIGWSWFLSYFWFHFCTATLCALVSTQLYERSEFIYLWVFWVLSFITIIVFCMTVAALTDKPTRAVLIGLLVFFAGVFLTNISGLEDSSSGTLGLISLHPVAAFAYGLTEIGYLEDLGIGLKSSTVGNTDRASGYTFASALWSLVFDCFIWGFVCFYLNRVITPDYGQAKSCWFPCQEILRCFRKKGGANSSDDANLSPIDESVPNEPVSDALKKQALDGTNIEIMGLRKMFGNKAAVDGLSLSMYSGQVTALLGHNGAGKTTTISMLTGALAPTEGYAKVAGRDIRYDMNNIRGEIGICLQHDCLFPLLTVREHLQFFSRIKGLYKQMSKKEAEDHIDQVVQDVALLEKRNTYSRNLSGGMKRKLSVAIAFCGNSKVVLLDEPTSGMDPFSRRFTWNVIRQYRRDRVIILTTHFMDEADILGDRIAIMSEGQLRCCGSPLFLKKKYGVGYQLTIEKFQGSNDKAIESNGGSSDIRKAKEDTLTSRDENLMAIVKEAVPDATLLSNVGSELSYQLPIGAASKFVGMFEELDRQVELKNIITYGVGITTLDEVFMLVARGDHKEQHREHFASSRFNATETKTDLSATSARSRMDLDKDNLFTTHVGALFRKRAANFRRDKKAWCCTTIMPSLFVFVGLILFKFTAPSRDLNEINLSLEKYNIAVKTEPKHPVLYNAAGSTFQCQPGNCVYQSFIASDEINGNEIGGFMCGQGSYVGPTSCTIDESDNVMTSAGDVVSPFAYPMQTIMESSVTLRNTTNEFAATRYGSILFNHEPSSTTSNDILFSEEAYSACLNSSQTYRDPSYCDRFGGIGYTIQYNYTAIHVAPTFVSIADQAILREVLNNGEIIVETGIYPLPITRREEGYGKAEDAFLAWFLLVLSFPFITGAFATFIVDERQSKAKHLQTVAGVTPSAYWISSFLWDVMNYQFPLWITFFLFLIFDVDILTTRDRNVIGAVICILLFYGPASAGFAYCVSFAFTSASLCNVVIIIFGFIIGMGGPLTCFILLLLGNDPGSPKSNLVTAANVITWFLRFTPSFCLGKGLFFVINIEALDYLEGKKVESFSEPVMLLELIFLILQTFLWLGLAMLLDKWSSNPRMMQLFNKFKQVVTCKCFCGPSGSNSTDITMALPDDTDVIAEQERVLQGNANEDLIVVSQLTKRYGNGKVAVNNMSLGIPPGQCFGLLGINGAGKTTTMQMLTAEFPPSDGDATLAGYSVRNEPEKTRRRIGYCPQFDAHFANMTGREHVELYASIKGVPKQFVKESAAAKLAEVGLSDEDSDRLSAGYSGGMKRRLSLACAMIGQPQIVFLDECSTGVDPVARREIWQLVSNMVSGKNVPPDERTSVVLTTHSMEECEALCPRIGIMANGRLRCLGSAQHLKNKFGQGYQIELKTKIVTHTDDDYIRIRMDLAKSMGIKVDEESTLAEGATFKSLKDLHTSLMAINPEGHLVTLINDSHPAGYTIYKNAANGVATLDEVASFATNEMRVRNVESFVERNYPESVLRERQDTKSRYEIKSEGLKISNLFATIEENKEALKLADYGISQTSLEQVFNMHAAEAEKLKSGRDDH